VDASQGVEQMLEQLTDKVLHQEEQIQQLEEEKNDLVSHHHPSLSLGTPSLIMAALWNRADHYIFPCNFYLLSFFFFLT